MPTYKVTSPDGRTVRLTGDSPPTETELEQVFANLPAAEPEEQFSGWESAGRGALEGVTLGFADELYGAARSAFTDESYEEARNRFRQEQAAAREEDPWTFGASEVVSGFALPGLGAAKAAGGAAKMLPRAARAAGVGAGYGATAGAGYSEGETVGEVAGDVARGTVLGGAAGAALPTAARAAQRLRNRYSAQNRVAREVGDMLRLEGVSTEDAAKMLKQNPEMVLADLTEEGRQRLTSLARENPDVYDLLTARDRRIGSQAVQRTIGEFDELAPMPAGEAIDTAYSRAATDDVVPQLSKLFGGMDPATAEIVPGKFTKRLLNYDKNIFKKVDESVAAMGLQPSKGTSARARTQNNRYLMSRVHMLLHELSQGKKATRGSRKHIAASLRQDILDDVRKNVNPDLADALDDYAVKMARRRELEPAYDRTTEAIRANPDKFMRELEYADVNSKIVKDLEAVLPPGETRETFLQAQQALRMMARTRADLVKERNMNPTIIREADTRLTRIRQDFGNLMRAFGASQFPGEHSLMIGAAVRRLYGSVLDAIPFFNMFPKSGSRDAKLVQTLAGRQVPLQTPVPQRPLSRTLATAAGGAGVMIGRD